uniref:Uncharacterized protein n=1 Tax=Nothoprocta perdicaria TaxID=30464 RepID=A0A8C6YQ44_NOTPE
MSYTRTSPIAADSLQLSLLLPPQDGVLRTGMALAASGWGLARLAEALGSSEQALRLIAFLWARPLPCAPFLVVSAVLRGCAGYWSARF